MADAMTHISTATLSGAAADYYVQFTSLPATYKHLRFVIGTGSRHNGNSVAGANAGVSIQGGSTAQITSLTLTGTSASFTGMGSATTRNSNNTAMGAVTGYGFWDGTEGGYNGCGILDIYNYASASYGNPCSYVYSNANGVSTNFGLEVGAMFRPTTSAMTSIEFGSSTGTGDNGFGSTSYPMHIYLFGIGLAA